MDLHDEPELAQGLREGSAESWRTLYDAFALRVWNSVARRVGPSSSDVADIVQESFLAAARSARNYNPARGSLWCWLSGIARNQTALFFRKRNLPQERDANGLDPPGREAEPAELLAAKELTIAVQKVLGRLPLGYEMLLVGKYLDELSLEDLAAAEQCTSSAISSKLAARQAFREEFEKQTQQKLSREASL